MPQWSLRTRLIATAIVPLAIFAISKSTPFYVSAVLTVATIAWIAVAIMAWIDTGSRQAWARGVILAATAYGLLVVGMGKELDLFGSNLATSRVLYYAHEKWSKPLGSQVQIPDGGTVLLGGIKRLDTSINDSDGIDAEPEEENLGLRAGPPYDNPQPVTVSTGTVVGRLPDFSHFRIPAREDFGKIGHIYWDVLFGLAGGWFAVWIESRKARVAKEQRSPLEQQ